MIGNPNNPRREAFRLAQAQKDRRAVELHIDRPAQLTAKTPPPFTVVGAMGYDPATDRLRHVA